MTHRIEMKEVLAWMAVILALVLFSATLAFAQDTSIKVTSENGKVRLITKHVENGKTITRDTTFEINNEEDMERIIESLVEMKDGSSAKSRVVIRKENKKDSGSDHVSIDLDIPEISEADRKQIQDEIQKSMDEMNASMEDMHKSLSKIHMQIDCAGDSEFTFNFNPDNCPGLRFNIYGDDIDSLSDEDHIVISGDENEAPPVLEKVITKDGKKLFVYRRDNPDRKVHSSPALIENFECYPNPNSGKFTVKFRSPEKGDFLIKITDEKGKIVFSKNEDGIKGNYSAEIDLSERGKGTYFVTVSDSDNSLTRKIIVN